MTTAAEKYTQLIKDKAKKFGFDSCGISVAGFLEEDAQRLEDWLQRGYHGEMKYMENYFDKRLDPRLLVEDSKSVISLMYNYFPEEELVQDFKISKYAYGEDYHDVIKDILKNMVAELQQEIGGFSCRVFVDSAPVLERSWAKRAGLGWIGKNGNLISRKKGSFFFLAEVICDLELVADGIATDHCGSCRRCIDACPTQAIVSDRIIDGSKCISYATIELKNEIPSYFHDRMDNWMYGCDICQDVCPWNRFSIAHHEPRFLPSPRLIEMDKKDWEEITQDVFSEIFRKSAVKRTKFSGLTRNILLLKEQEKKRKIFQKKE